MKTIFKHLLAALMLLLGSVNMNAEVYSGNCGDNGDNVKWTLDTETGLLSITGSGNMSNYTNNKRFPWYSYRAYIKKVIMENGVTSIGDCAFSECSGLLSITIHDGVTSIGKSAFYNCSSLPSITIPESVTSIGDAAFESCNGLFSITIHDGVTSIGRYAFHYCSGLTSVTIPESVTSIGDYAFESCNGLISVTIPESVTTVGYGVFLGCNDISKPTYNSKFFVRLPVSYRGEYVIPTTIETICDHAFDGCSGLTSINIPKGVTSIWDCAFRRCSGLSSINIPEGVTSIGGAFYGCSGLTSITIPSSVTSIGSSAFGGCSGLTSINIPESVTSIEYKTFSGCSGLTSINIPSSVTSIGESAFYNCSSLPSITIPESVTSIGDAAFSGCSSLTSITIPMGVTSIGSGAFYGCSGLISIIVNGNVSTIGKNAFTVGVTPQYVEINGNIPANPYWNTSRLAEVKIGDKVTMLYSQFSGCSALRKVTLGKSLQYIRNDNFKNCTALDSVICYSEEPPYCYPGVFDGANLSKCTLVVPDAAGEKYENTEPWNKFGKIVYKKPTFILTYMIDGEVYKTVEVEKGADITPESTPEREGYTFSGWSDLPESMPAENITVKGTFTINQYWVTYEVDGKTYTSEKLDYGSAVTPPTMQEKEGCDFVWEDYPENVPANDITIKGHYVPRTYILTYILDGEEYKTIEVTYGSGIQAEEIAEREGYTFSGWEGLPNTMPAGNITVTGTFTINRYTLTYILNGEVYKTEEVEYGSSITPEMPEKEGYIFSGWEGLPDTMPAGNVTVTATFVPNSFTLTYLIDGEEYKTYTLTFGADITPENAPEREGYTFSGWDGLPGTMPAGNVTVTGRYTVNEYWVTYMVDGVPYTSEKVAYGSVIVPPGVPEKEGYDFSWAYIPDTMPAKDIMVYGSYTTGIAEIMADRNVAGIYSIDGKRLSRPQRGVNIIRMKDGMVKRVMVK